MSLRKLVITVAALLFVCSTVLVGTAAAETKIGIMNIQKVVAASKAGKKVKVIIEKKVQEVQQSFKGEEESLLALQDEIEKKSSVWSDEVKAQKVRDFNIKKRDLKQKNDDARFEIRQLEKKELQPVLQKLDGVVKDFGKKNGYTVIFDIKAGVLFLDEKIDVTDQLIAELDKVTQ